MITPPRRVVLDTNVLFSRVFHETYGYLGAEGVVSVMWFESILAARRSPFTFGRQAPQVNDHRRRPNYRRAVHHDSHRQPRDGDGAARGW